jgi:DNA-binding winged helix-turn-helix (wHTH) protein
MSFAAYRVLPRQRLLFEGSTPLALGSRAFDILILLAQRSGELVTRNELLSRVWPGVHVVDANLTVQVAALRRTLHDGRDGNRFIVVVPGRGYYFVAEVTCESLPPQDARLALANNDLDPFDCSPAGSADRVRAAQHVR